MNGSPEVAACRDAAPAYVTGLSALAWHGVCSVTPVRVQLATLRSVEGARRGADLLPLPDDLFDGFADVDDPFGGGRFALASPERAFVDYLYRCERTGERPEISLVDLDTLEPAEVRRWAARAGVDVIAHLSGRPGGRDDAGAGLLRDRLEPRAPADAAAARETLALVRDLLRRAVRMTDDPGGAGRLLRLALDDIDRAEATVLTEGVVRGADPSLGELTAELVRLMSDVRAAAKAAR